MSKPTKYIVTITKKIEYLSSVIDKRNKLKDLFHKAEVDLVETIISNGSLGGFEISLDSEMPYLSKRLEKSEDSLGKRRLNSVNLEYCIREFVKQDMIDKYGEIDHEINPHLFIKSEEEIFDEDDKVVDVEISYHYNDELENFWNRRYDSYMKIIKTKTI